MQVVTLCGRIYSGLKGEVMKAARYTVYSTLAGFPRAESQVFSLAESNFPARQCKFARAPFDAKVHQHVTPLSNENNLQ